MSRKTREKKNRYLPNTNKKRSLNDTSAYLLTYLTALVYLTTLPYLNKKIHQYLVYLLMSSTMSGSISSF